MSLPGLFFEIYEKIFQFAAEDSENFQIEDMINNFLKVHQLICMIDRKEYYKLLQSQFFRKLLSRHIENPPILPVFYFGLENAVSIKNFILFYSQSMHKTNVISMTATAPKTLFFD